MTYPAPYEAVLEVLEDEIEHHKKAINRHDQIIKESKALAAKGEEKGKNNDNA